MFFALCIVLLLAFIVWWISRTKKPLVFYNKNGEIAPIVERLKQIKEYYSPTPWLINRHVHTIWGMHYRGPSLMKPERQIIDFADGGAAALDWFMPKDPKPHCPVVVVLHTLGGGTREPCVSHLCEVLSECGFIAVVANSRGCSGVPFKTERMYNAVELDDIDAIVQFVRKEKEPEDIFMAGFSMGAYNTAQYCANYEGLTAAACFSHTYDGTKASKPFSHGFSGFFYEPFMMSKLKHQALKNPFIPEETKKKIPGIKKLVDFDTLLTIPRLGVKTYQEYYDQTRAKDKIPISKCPMLFLGADDDPFTMKELMPIQECIDSQKCVFVETCEGGHVSFCEGITGKQTLPERIAPEWFREVAKYNREHKTV